MTGNVTNKQFSSLGGGKHKQIGIRSHEHFCGFYGIYVDMGIPTGASQHYFTFPG